jgi:hypothetical protein
MHRDDLMKSELLSETVLLTGGILILLASIFFLALALAPAIH